MPHTIEGLFPFPIDMGWRPSLFWTRWMFPIAKNPGLPYPSAWTEGFRSSTLSAILLSLSSLGISSGYACFRHGSAHVSFPWDQRAAVITALEKATSTLNVPGRAAGLNFVLDFDCPPAPYLFQLSGVPILTPLSEIRDLFFSCGSGGAERMCSPFRLMFKTHGIPSTTVRVACNFLPSGLPEQARLTGCAAPLICLFGDDRRPILPTGKRTREKKSSRPRTDTKAPSHSSPPMSAGSPKAIDSAAPSPKATTDPAAPPPRLSGVAPLVKSIFKGAGKKSTDAKAPSRPSPPLGAGSPKAASAAPSPRSSPPISEHSPSSEAPGCDGFVLQRKAKKQTARKPRVDYAAMVHGLWTHSLGPRSTPGKTPQVSSPPVTSRKAPQVSSPPATSRKTPRKPRGGFAANLEDIWSRHPVSTWADHWADDDDDDFF